MVKKTNGRMKFNPKIFVAISIAIVPVCFFILLIENIMVERAIDSVNYIIDFGIPAILIINAVFIVPVVMYRKLNIDDRKLYTKRLAILALVLFLLATIFIYAVGYLNWTNSTEFGWTIILFWIWTLVGLISFISTIVLVIIVTAIYKTIIRNERKISNVVLSVMFNFMFPIFLIASPQIR